MTKFLCVLALLIFTACNKGERPSVEPPKTQSATSTAKESDDKTVQPTKKVSISRSGDLGNFKLSLTPCTHSSNFEEAVAKVMPLVVGVAAGQMEGERFSPRALGSGIIITNRGFVITHYHTVSEYELIRVRLSDGRLLAAERMGEDFASDLVLLKIDGDAYPSPTIASADTLRVGQWVASVGSPLGVQQSLSAGIVSSTFRPYPNSGDDELIRYVQSDVAIHPGSSGGPLIDACGRLVAMNSAILGPGMSFSVRIDQMLAIAEKLYSDAEFERGYIGVLLQKDMDNNVDGAVVVRRVVKNGPASIAGLKKGDKIFEANGKKIQTHHRLKWIVATTEVGDPLVLKVKRGEKTFELSVEVDSRAERP